MPLFHAGIHKYEYGRRRTRLPKTRAILTTGLLWIATALGCVRNHVLAPATNAPEGVVWRYEVRASGPRVDDLLVDASFPAGTTDELGVDDDAAPFLRDVNYASPAGWVPVAVRGATWAVPCASGCRVRYRYALGEAASKLDDPEMAIRSGDVIVAPPATWLLRPEARGGRFRFHVKIDPPSRFAAGTRASADGAPDTFEASTNALENASFAVFGPFDLETIHRGTARIDVAIAPYALSLSDADVAAWVSTAVDGIGAYYGRFPVDRTLVIVQAGRQGSPTRGATLGDGGPAILVRAARTVSAETTRDDWVMTHELIHASLPSFPQEHAWLSEGIPTYVEPVVRARAGLVTPETFWHDLVEGLPQGLPEAGDQGLDRTHTWGRTYWGGALFCFVVDVTIRERTNNTRSLDDALRGVVATGADVEAQWTVEQFLEAGDRATGAHVLHELYRDMALAPGTVDLPALWQRLGVRVEGGRVSLDDGAPLADVRRAITGARSER